jgi:hypothetical protein
LSADPCSEVDARDAQNGDLCDVQKTMTWPLLFAAMLQFLLAVAVPPRPEEMLLDTKLSYLVGHALGEVLIIGGALYYFVGRKRDRDGWWKIPLVLLPVAFLGGMIAAGSQLDSQDAAINSIAAAGERMIATDGMDAGPGHHSGATGEAGELERVSLAIMRTVAEDRRNYDREIAESGVIEMLSPDRLRNRGDIADARRKVGLARGIVERYRELHAARIAEAPALFENADISRSSRASALAGFRESVRRGPAEQMWTLEAEIVDVYDDVLDILDRGRWVRQDDSFLFDSARDLNDFNSELARIDRATGEQQRLAAAHRRRLQDDLNGLSPGR